MMTVNYESVVRELLSQIATLSHERAVYSALASQYQQELEKLQQECEQLKQGNRDENS